MRKTLTLSQQTEEYLTALKTVYMKETGATRVTDGWIVNQAVTELYNKKIKPFCNEHEE